MKHLLSIAFLILFTQLQAQVRIGETEAHATAKRFLSQNNKQDEQTLTLREEIKSMQSGQTNLYVFSMEPQGFIIVSALDEVLAYSFASTLPEKEMLPDPFIYWLDLYNERTDYLMEHPSHARKPSKNQQEVGPLLTSIWGQGCFHNEACPVEVTGPCQHVEAGCVAIAMAQIMYYHKLPLKGNGSMTYICPTYGLLSAHFSNTSYHWEDMVDTVRQSNSAVAELISHCGIGAQMIYGAHSSVSSGTAALRAFQEFFYYPFATYLSRNNFSEEEWTALIRQDIENQHPVYYEGKSSLGTHAFVCDGYDSSGLFHFNFGWDGVADGYYTLNSPYGFSTNQSCIHNIIPLANIPIQCDEYGIIYVTPDGNGDGSSWENATSDLQSAIYKSNIDKNTIWVKEGTYMTESTDGHAFNLFGDCLLYGGFKGDEPFDYDLSLRDFEAHPSILDGNHSNGVLKMQFAVNPVLIDGFTIQNGMAYQGGGIFANCLTHIRNCKFCFNFSGSNGGGLSLHSSSSEKSIIENCEFFGNEANTFGGAVYDRGITTYLNCLFSNNLSHKFGGGIATIKQGATFWNCLINNNTAEIGGGCYLKNSANLFNCTIVKNEAQSDYGGVYVPLSSSKDGIRNCIIWGNVSAGENAQIGPQGMYSDCAVEGESSGTNLNSNADEDNDGEAPRFYVRFRNPSDVAGVAGQAGDWRLQSNSLCINRGANLSNQLSTDLDGNPRCQHWKVDLGAYESDVATQDITAYFCENDPYYYQDSLLSELGFYTFLHPGDPYDNLVVIQMQPPLPSVFLTEIICENETFDFFGTPLTEAGRYYKTVDCVTHELDLSLKPWDSAYMQKEICEDETFDFFGTPLNEAGTYYETVECTTYRLDLSIKPSTDFHMEETICEGETYNFFGRSLRNGGQYIETIDCQSYILDLTVNQKPALHCSSDTIVEYGNPTVLIASGADSYLWSTGDTTDRITVFPTADHKYSVQGFSENGCAKTASVTVQVINELDEMVLFPNPAIDKVEIYMPLIDEVNVFNLFGERICHIDANREAVKLDVSTYPTGVYVVHVQQLNKNHYKQLVICH